MPTHLHIDQRSQDCDGTYDRTSVVRAEDGGDGSDLIYCEIGWHTGVTDGDETLVVWRYAPNTEVTVSHRTDEGYETTIISECDDETCGDVRTFRDHTAEQAGY